MIRTGDAHLKLSSPNRKECVGLRWHSDIFPRPFNRWLQTYPKTADKHGKPCLHMDLNEISDYIAVFNVRKWMYDNTVDILNVAGSRASKDRKISDAVFKIIKEVYWTDKIKGENQDTNYQGEALYKPRTVDEAVDQILAEFPLRDQVETANMSEEDLAILQAILAKYISEKLDDWSVSKELYDDYVFKYRRFKDLIDRI